MSHSLRGVLNAGMEVKELEWSVEVRNTEWK